MNIQYKLVRITKDLDLKIEVFSNPLSKAYKEDDTTLFAIHNDLPSETFNFDKADLKTALLKDVLLDL